MKKHRTEEGRQVNTLVDMGFAQDVPIADFSDQPDSGGRIGGVRGVDEFGIEGGVAEEWSAENVSKVTSGGFLVDRVQAGAESLEEFSSEAESDEIARVLEGESPQEAEIDSLPSDLLGLIEYRLKNHDRIDSSNVSVRIESPGLVVLNGRVRSDSESLRVAEVVSALPGVYTVRNRLAVPR
jgi:hypothetical protein